MADDVTKVDFFTGDYRRRAADGGPIILRNRVFELNPQLSEDGASLLARPGMRYLTSVGAGPIRAVFTEEGSFNGDMFVASYDQLIRVNKILANTVVYTGLYSPERGTVNMTVTSAINEVPEFLFFADGRTLFVYMENGYARNTLQGAPANGDVVRIGDTYYQFTNASVDAGTPAGTVGSPWLVNVGASATQAFQALFYAINASGEAGVDYSTDLESNGLAIATNVAGTFLVVQATLIGALGNAVATTETGANLAWDGATMSGGGTPSVRQVDMPEDIGVIDVATINSYVIVLPVQEGEYRGRFYWIEPGETTVDPLSFATAERSPDAVNGIEVIGDMFWLPGDGSTEVWYVSQDPTNRMQRLQGVVFDRGTWEGTAVAIHGTLFVCDSGGAVFAITGGTPERISTPGIEQEIREAIQYQQHLTP